MNKSTAFILAWPNEKVYAEGWLHKAAMQIGFAKEMLYRVGHSALVLVNPQKRLLEYYDFGRYMTPAGKGRMRSAETDPDVIISLRPIIDTNRVVQNIEEIAFFFSSNPQITHGGGTMFLSISQNIDYDKAKAYIQKTQDRGSVKYGATGFGSLNCSRFVAQAVYAGAYQSKTRLKLLFPETIRANALGNVVNGSDNGKVWKITNQQIEILHLNRWDALHYTYKNLLISFTGNKREEYKDVTKCGQFLAPEKPEALQNKNVQWLGGLGAGMWLRLDSATNNPEKGLYRVRRYERDGSKVFDIICKLNEENTQIDLNSPFQFIHDVHQLKVNILQQGSLKTLHFHRQYQEAQQRILA